jgi:hypothetical protein
MSDPFPDEIDEADEACLRADAIRELLRSRGGSVTTAAVAAEGSGQDGHEIGSDATIPAEARPQV